MRRAALVVLAACHPASDHKLPSAAITPQVLARVAPTACGIDIAFDGNKAPDIRYRYTYDSFGRLARAVGTYTSGTTETVEYTWDNLDHLMHQVQTGESHAETTASYDTLGDLVLYTTTQTAPHYADARTYTFADFTDAGQPATERLSVLDAPDTTYHFEYDAANRIARAVSDTGSITTYAYDDAESRTITVDTDGGASHGVLSYDDDNRQLAETWGGSEEISSETRYDWAADRLLTVTYSYGTQDAPRELRVFEVDTLRYDCASR